MIKSLYTFQLKSWLLPVLALACVIPLDVILGAGRTRHFRSNEKVYQAPQVVYKLSPFDLVKVSVYGQDDLACEQRISDKGILSMPLLGGILVGNSTVSEAEDLVEQVFVQQQYLRNPVVSISIQEFAPKMVTILGEVEQPGAIAIPPGQNGVPLLVAVAGAGGFTGTAKLTQVRVTRASRGAVPQQIDIVNAGKLLDSIETGQSRSMVVHPDDIIFVPKRVF
jgi:protein involved in polysaccharide export with SLBB domain